VRNTRPIDLTEKKFGRLLVIERSGHIGTGRAWKCVCDCGNVRLVTSGALKSGHSKSCGCLQREIVAKISKEKNTIHGMSHTPVFNSWNSMIQRCYNPKTDSFKDYGGRGILACEFLRASPENLKTILGERFQGFSLERINVNGGYTCGACSECLLRGWIKNIKWGTHKEQARNKRNSLMVEIDGQIKTAGEWEELYGLYESCISNRIRNGTSGKDLLKPCKKNNPKVLINGEEKRISEWAASSGLTTKSIWARLKRGWTGERLIKPRRTKFYKGKSLPNN
jgi:hypothetical protein